jgi:hypothetical protein
VPARSVRKRFKGGDHVKVMSGKNADESGLVVSVSGNIVTFLSDISMQEVGFILSNCSVSLKPSTFDRFLCSPKTFVGLPQRLAQERISFATTNFMI